MMKKQLSPAGRIILDTLNRRGEDKKQFCLRIGISRPTFDKIIKGKTQKSKLLPRIAEGLDIDLNLLRDGYDGLLNYTLDNAPKCEQTYILALKSASELGFGKDFLGGAQVDVVVIPWDEEAQERSLLVLFRMKGHSRALIAERSTLGDDRIMTPVLTSPSHPAVKPLYEGRSGECLGAIADIASLRHLFLLP